MQLRSRISRLLLHACGFTILFISIFSLLSCGGSSPAPINAVALGAVSVQVVPPSMSVPTGTTQAFTANVNNSGVSSVQWLVNGIPGGNATVGTIDSSGNFTAPQFIPNPASVTITAIADADNTKSGTAQATITGAQVPAQVLMSPTGTAYLQVGTSMPLSGAVTGPADTGILWQVVNNGTVVTNGNSSFGTITPGANGNATYKAPAALPPGGTVTIRAASHAQPNVFASCTVVISIGSPTIETVIISPVAAIVPVQSDTQFTVTIIGTTSEAATWTIAGAGTSAGDAAHGTISQGGLYNAPVTPPVPPPPPIPPPTPTPPAPSTVTIKVASQTQATRSASATVTILPCSTELCTAVSINPSSAAIAIQGQQAFTASVTNASSQTVTWYVNGVAGGNSTYGKLSPVEDNAQQMTYTAPSTIPALNPVILSAVPTAAPTLTATAVLNIVPPDVTVTITPSSPCAQINATQDFQAAVTGISNQSVNWYVNNVLSGNATVGTIANTGSDATTYTAPATVPTKAVVAITAASLGDPSATPGVATLTIVANPMITLTPPTKNVEASLSQTITATPCAGLSNLNLFWYVNGEQGGDPTIGTINPTPDTNPPQASYLAPLTIPNPASVAVTAIDQNSGTTSSTAIMTIVPLVQPVTISVDPSSVTLMPSQSQEFTADVNNTSDKIVNWTLTGVPGGCTPALCGTINGGIIAQTNDAPVNYVAPASIPADPKITLVATADAAPNPQASAAITIAILPASISIAPVNPTVQAGTTSPTTFAATVENVDPTTTSVSWTLGCNSQAPDGFLGPENCGSFLGDGAGPGCLSDNNGHDICASGSFSDLATVSLSYVPPKILGSNFEENACTQSAGTNGLVPLTGSFSATNCPGGTCTATVCITVTPP
jgi:hypothetical protein